MHDTTQKRLENTALIRKTSWPVRLDTYNGSPAVDWSGALCSATAALLVGLWVLLMPTAAGEAPFAVAAPALTVALAAWTAAAYCATAAAPVRALPPLAQSLGLYAAHGGDVRGAPIGPLLGLLAVTVAMAGLSRSRRTLPPAGR